MYVTAIAFENSLYRQLYLDPDYEAREVERHRRALRGPRRREYPTMAALAPAMTRGDGLERFELGLDVLINGLLATPTEGRLNPVAWEQQP